MMNRFLTIILCFILCGSARVAFAADIQAILDDSAGSAAWSVTDSGSVEKARVNSVGNMVLKGCLRLNSAGTLCTAAQNLIVDGNIGIGSITPGAALDVQGTTRTTAFQIPTNPSSGYVLTSNSVGIGTWMAAGTLASGSVSNGTINQVAKYAVTGPTVSGSSILFDDATNVGVGTSTPQAQFVVSTGKVGIGTWTATERMIIKGGNLGIGTTTAPQSLYVAGTAEAQGFKLNQNASAGYVLTSNSVGVGTWMAAGTLSSGSVNSGTINRFAIYASTGSVVSDQTILYSDATNVGIGTAGPSTLLDVNRLFNVLSGGNVGIGSINPGQPLDIAGNIRERGTNSLFFGDDNKASITPSATTTPDINF